MTSNVWFRLWTVGLPCRVGETMELERRRPENSLFRFRCDLEMTGDRWNENPTIFGTIMAALIFGVPSWGAFFSADDWLRLPLWLHHTPFANNWAWACAFAGCAVYMAFAKLTKSPCAAQRAAGATGGIWMALTIAVYSSGYINFAWIAAPLMVRNCLILYLCFAFKCKHSRLPCL